LVTNGNYSLAASIYCIIDEFEKEHWYTGWLAPLALKKSLRDNIFFL
jgi:phenylpyruvate tautomerase PptA (4-oxalocrotonate tautomerase family)